MIPSCIFMYSSDSLTKWKIQHTISTYFNRSQLYLDLGISNCNIWKLQYVAITFLLIGGQSLMTPGHSDIIFQHAQLWFTEYCKSIWYQKGSCQDSCSTSFPPSAIKCSHEHTSSIIFFIKVSTSSGLRAFNSATFQKNMKISTT